MILDPLRLVIGGAFLLYAAILDIRTRRVPNRVWVVMGAIGILLLHLHILLKGSWYHHLVIFPVLALYSFPFIELTNEVGDGGSNGEHGMDGGAGKEHGIANGNDNSLEGPLIGKPDATNGEGEQRTDGTGFFDGVDLKAGIISPMMWYCLIASGFIGFLLLLILGGTGTFTLTLVGMTVFILLVYLMYFTGLIFGGADAKGMMAVTLFVPFYPTFSIFPIFETESEALRLMFTFPVVILTLSVVSFALLPIIMACYNVIRGDIGIPMFFGYRMPLSEIPGKFVWLMEKPQYRNDYGIKLMTLVGETSGMQSWLREQMFTGEVKTEYFPSKNTSASLDSDLQVLKRMGMDRVWVTPKIPFMVAILVGYIFSFLVGNVLFAFMDWISG